MEGQRAPKVYIGDLVAEDLIAKFSPVLGTQYYIRDSDRKITCDVRVEIDTPWIHVRTNPLHYCKLWHDIFNCLGFIPTPCLNCWKVVVKLRTVEQAMELLQLMKEDLTGSCKIGMERRKYSRGHFGAYFYNDSIGEGRNKYLEIYRAMEGNGILAALLEDVDKAGKTTRIILKRYCTEFELSLGPSDQYRPPPSAAEWERKIDERFDMPQMGMSQPKDLQDHILREWIEFAWDRDDPTVWKYNKGGPMYTPPVTYHGRKPGRR